MTTSLAHRKSKFEWGPDNPPMPVAACSLCIHLGIHHACTAYPNGIPADILAGKDYHFDIRKDQIGTDVFSPPPGITLPQWLMRPPSALQTASDEPAKTEHEVSTGQFRVIACDTFESPFADEFVGDYSTLDAAIEAAKANLVPMTAVYVYDETGQLRFNEYMPSL
jgi:hypothetical protein